MTYHGSNSKEKYREACREHDDIHVFMCDWWLDIMCDNPENWDVCLCTDEKGQVQGALTYATYKFGFWKVVFPPPLSPFGGIWIRTTTQSSERDTLNRRREITENLVRQLPNMPYIELKLAPDCTDWIPFFREGFRQSTRYTYQLRDISDTKLIWGQFGRSRTRNIEGLVAKQGQDLSIRAGQDLSLLLSAYQTNLSKKGVSWKFSLEKFGQMDAALVKHDKRLFFEVVDENKTVVGSKYVILSGNTAYGMLSFSTEKARKNGLGAWMTWEAIKICSAKGIKIFDFEGSMLLGVEEYFRSFGGIQTPYHHLVRTSNKLVTLLAAWRGKI